MKKILYIIGVLLALASCTEEETAMQEQGVTEQTFSVAISEPDYAPQTRATVTMSRYLLEMYEGGINGNPMNMVESDDGTFNVTMKKGVDYLCLFWADEGADAYNAYNMPIVFQKDETKPGTAAYWARVTVNSNNFNGNITLKRAVAELSFIDKKGLTEADNTLKITYPYARAVMDLSDGTVGYGKGSPVVHTLTGITPPSSPADAFATDFILAPAEAGKLTGLKLQLNSEEEKTIAEAVIQANYKTKITGEYEAPLPSMSITIDTRKNTSNTSDATFSLPLKATLSGYSLIVDWGDGQTKTFPDGTELKEDNMTHTYGQAGQYTITITSTQRDGTQVQMPKIYFYANYTENDNQKKLVSLNTPLLNMGTELDDCFNSCSNLTAIPAGLFDNNPDATTFFFCFGYCKGLTGTIPTGLFDKNTKVKSFRSCFNGCEKLTGEIPTGLFNNHPDAENFGGCFSDCKNLKPTADIFCDDANDRNTRFAGKEMSFDSCFKNCGSETDGDGTFPALWDYAMTGSSYSHADCFAGAKATNAGDVPTDGSWGTPATTTD